MPREVYDPKDPDLEFYNADRPRRESNYEPRPRRKNILKSKIFIIGYGIFLIACVFAITLYQKKAKGLKHSIEIKVNEALVYTDNIKTTVQIMNKNYVAENDNIPNMIVYSTLKGGRITIASNYTTYTDILFRANEHIGISLTFSKEDWLKSDSININILLDKTNAFNKNIKTRFIKMK